MQKKGHQVTKTKEPREDFFIKTKDKREGVANKMSRKKLSSQREWWGPRCILSRGPGLSVIGPAWATHKNIVEWTRQPTTQ